MHRIELVPKRGPDGTITLAAAVVGRRERIRRALRRLRLAAA